MPVTLLGATWEPKLPPSYTVRAEVLLQHSAEVHARGVAPRGLAAAIGVTWAHPDPKQRLPPYERFEEPAAYGKAIFDELQTRGVSIKRITDAGLEAIRALDDSMVTEEQLQARADFSEASPAPSASGSGPDASVASAGDTTA